MEENQQKETQPNKTKQEINKIITGKLWYIWISKCKHLHVMSKFSFKIKYI